MQGIRICDLLDYPQHITTISRWMWQEWDKSRDWTLEQSIKEAKAGAVETPSVGCGCG